MSGWITVEAAYDGTFASYVTDPDAQSRKPGLVVCSETFGVNSHMRNIADRFASKGYVVAVPDLLWRIEPGMEIAYDEAGLRRGSEIAEGFDKKMGGLDLKRMIADLRL